MKDGSTFRSLWAAAAVPWVVVACGSTTAPRPVKPEMDLHHPSATRRLEAISAVATTRSTEHVPALIELLEDEDSGVRLHASQTLKSLTGRDTGYKPFGPPEERAKQAADWRAWWASRRGTPTPPPPPPSVPGKPR